MFGLFRHRVHIEPDPARFVCLSGRRFGAKGAIPASHARFEISRRRAWGHDVRAYPTTDRHGTAFTVIYTRVDYPYGSGAEDLVTAFEFPADSDIPRGL
ncbi:hypothetical protein ACFWY6_04535 [Streptomyces sp. NPDC059037]|uniref:hypothetical protein n=1 Tax=Streptomyces sp. NPDC059037 TaxID=3346710 RepID=UPI003684889A